MFVGIWTVFAFPTQTAFQYFLFAQQMRMRKCYLSCSLGTSTYRMDGIYPCQFASLRAYTGSLKLGFGNNIVHCSLKSCFVESFWFLQYPTYCCREKGEQSFYKLLTSIRQHLQSVSYQCHHKSIWLPGR